MSTTIDTRGLSCPQPVLMFLTAVKGDAQGPFCVGSSGFSVGNPCQELAG